MITSNNEVYKCLSNNNNAVSINEPIGIGSPANNYIQTMPDGYQWKYMLQVQGGDIFFNSFWFATPLIPPTNSLQALIVNAAVPGSIDVINVIQGGTNFANSAQAYIVNIVGDGSGANAYAVVSNNSVQNIIMVNRGENYSYANVLFTDANGINALAYAIMPPQGGHGSEPA